MTRGVQVFRCSSFDQLSVIFSCWSVTENMKLHFAMEVVATESNRSVSASFSSLFGFMTFINLIYSSSRQLYRANAYKTMLCYLPSTKQLMENTGNYLVNMYQLKSKILALGVGGEQNIY